VRALPQSVTALRERCAAFARTPFRVPPGSRAHLGPTNVAGLITHGDPGTVLYPLYSEPWAPYQSTVFPRSLGSACAANGVKPAWGVAINAYSPIAHRNGMTMTVPPKARSGLGVARPTQRARPYALGYATRWPQTAPRWPTWGEAVAMRRPTRADLDG
jgi:hypothetical protein